MTTINKENFYANLKTFRPLNQEQVNNLNFILQKLDESTVINYVSEYAYILATIYHETAGTFAPVEEGYWIKTNRLQKLYNYYAKYNPHALNSIFPNGAREPAYYGRGYVQLTHKWNYQRFGLIDNPDEAMNYGTAWRILEKGMTQGLFTGKKLADYFTNNSKDFYRARKIINGLDRSSLIAGYANIFYSAIKLI